MDFCQRRVDESVLPQMMTMSAFRHIAFPNIAFPILMQGQKNLDEFHRAKKSQGAYPGFSHPANLSEEQQADQTTTHPLSACDKNHANAASSTLHAACLA